MNESHHQNTVTGEFKVNQNPTTTSPETENKASANQTDLDKLIVSIEDTEKQKKTDTNKKPISDEDIIQSFLKDLFR